MSRIILLFVLCATLWRVEGAALVGPGGTGVLTFNTPPDPSNWTSRTVTGGSASISDATSLDAAVQLLSARDVTNALPATRTIPPSANALGRWNGVLQLLQSKLDGVSFTVIMATLQNKSGGDVQALNLRYELSSDTFPEQVPGYRVYISLSGESNSWQVVPGLSTGMPGVLSDRVVFNGPWASNANLYVLFADDNAASSDSYQTIDNFAVWPELPADVVTAVGVNGTGTNDFSTYSEASAWRMRSYYQFFGSQTNITNAAMLDARVQGETALEGFGPMGTTATTPSDPGARADYHVIWECLVTSPAGNDYTAMTCTLRNDTGSEQFALTVSYEATDGVTNGMEQVPRFRVYYSLTGLPGMWQVIPEFCNATGTLNVRLELGRWPAGAHLFLLWADDNGPFGRSNDLPGSVREGVNRIDNFAASVAREPRLKVLQREGTSIILGWAAGATGYSPQSAALVNDNEWEPVVINLLTSNDFSRVRVARTNDAARFFRLKQEARQEGGAYAATRK